MLEPNQQQAIEVMIFAAGLCRPNVTAMSIHQKVDACEPFFLMKTSRVFRSAYLSIALFFIAVAHGEIIKNGPSLQE